MQAKLKTAYRARPVNAVARRVMAADQEQRRARARQQLDEALHRLAEALTPAQRQCRQARVDRLRERLDPVRFPDIGRAAEVRARRALVKAAARRAEAA